MFDAIFVPRSHAPELGISFQSADTATTLRSPRVISKWKSSMGSPRKWPIISRRSASLSGRVSPTDPAMAAKRLEKPDRDPLQRDILKPA